MDDRQITMLPVDALAPSTGNPRRYIDAASITELARSIAKLGVISPIIVQPAEGRGDAWDIIAGERRWMAARQAGLTLVPCDVWPRHAPDAVLAVQVTENLQRDELHPLDEARSYRILREEHGKSVDEIAAMVAKSRAYVFRRLQLTSLIEDARPPFLAGRMTAAVALLVARMPTEDGQRLVLGEVVSSGEPVSVADASQRIRRNVLKPLDDATFDTEKDDITPGVGPCSSCPKRADRIFSLFDAEQGHNLCVDPVCYAAKTAAETLRVSGSAQEPTRTPRRPTLTPSQRRTHLRHSTQRRTFEIVRDQAVQSVDAGKPLTDEFWVALALCLSTAPSAIEVLAQWGIPSPVARASLEELKPRELRALVLDLAFGIVDPGHAERILPVAADCFGLNIEEASQRAREQAIDELPKRRNARAREPAQEESG